jgi:hypothetical protein
VYLKSINTVREEREDERLPGGHNVVEVHNFNKGLDFASLLKLGLTHGSHNSAWVAVNTGDYKEKISENQKKRNSPKTHR